MVAKTIPSFNLEYLPKQLQFMQTVDTVPFAAYIGGFGSGKTHVLNLQILRELCANPGSLGLVGAPTYRILQNTTQRKFFELCPPSCQLHRDQTNLTLNS